MVKLRTFNERQRRRNTGERDRLSYFIRTPSAARKRGERLRASSENEWTF